MTSSQKVSNTFDKKSQIRYLSLSPNEKDYIQFTRTLPSSNPIRTASPDIIVKPEKIPSTRNPFDGLKKTNGFEGKQPVQNEDIIENYRKEIKMLKIDLERIKGENEQLKKSEIINNKDVRHSTHSPSIRESEAKIIAKKFAEERFKAENSAQLWMKKYEELRLKINEYEKTPNKATINPQVLQEMIIEIKAWEQKANDTDKLMKDLRSECETYRRKNEDLEKNIRNILQELGLWQQKYDIFEKEKLMKMHEYEENIRFLTENLSKTTNEAIKLKECLKKQDSELILSQNRLMEKDIEISKEKTKKASNQPENSEIHQKFFLLSSIIENYENQMKTWESRCLSIETDWSTKYHDLENSLRKSGSIETNFQRQITSQIEDISRLSKKNEVSESKISVQDAKILELLSNLDRMRDAHRGLQESESRLKYENENNILEKRRIQREIENAKITEYHLKQEIETFKEKCSILERTIEDERVKMNDLTQIIKKTHVEQESREQLVKTKTEKDIYEQEINALKLKLMILSAESDKKDSDIVFFKDQLKYVKINKDEVFFLKKKLEEAGEQIKLLSKVHEEKSIEYKELDKIHYEHREKDKKALIGASEEFIQKNKSLEDEIYKLKDKIQEFSKENEDIRRENDIYKEKYKKNSINIQELEKIIRETSIFSNEKVEIEAERLAYETAIGQMKGRIVDLEHGLANNIKEFDEYKRNNMNNVKEKEELRRKIAKFDNISLFSQESNNINYILQKENDELKNDYKELKAKVENERKAYEIQIVHLKNMVENLKSDLERSYLILEERRKERDETLQKFESFKINGNFEKNEGISYKSEVFKEKYDFLMKQCEEIKNARDQYKSQAERNSIELSNKNREMVIKIQELEDLKSKYQKSLYNLNNLESKLLMKLQNQEIYIE